MSDTGDLVSCDMTCTVLLLTLVQYYFNMFCYIVGLAMFSAPIAGNCRVKGEGL